MVIKSRLLYLIAEYEIREGKRLSLKRLAQETGLAESTLRNFAYNTTQRFDASVLEALCVYFGVAVGDLLVYEIEEEKPRMTYQFPESAESAINTLTDYYPDIIKLMGDIFTSHEFILKLAQKHQQDYIGALSCYINNSAPFRDLHSRLAIKLLNFNDLIEKIKDDYPSVDIFGSDSKCARWKKK